MDAIADKPTEKDNLKGKSKRPDPKSSSKASAKSPSSATPTKSSKRYATAVASLRDTNWPLQNFFMVNGRSAPLISPLNVKSGERIRFRVINASQDRIPLHLTGHRFEICATNGSEGMEPHVMRDTVCLEPSDRYDLEITTDNPGVWSFGSESLEQCTYNGKFPGGIAIILRYDELMHPKSAK
jgi:FtsP/CotA-like multicopper oxidase with cupredoxin domain